MVLAILLLERKKKRKEKKKKNNKMHCQIRCHKFWQKSIEIEVCLKRKNLENIDTEVFSAERYLNYFLKNENN